MNLKFSKPVEDCLYFRRLTKGNNDFLKNKYDTGEGIFNIITLSASLVIIYVACVVYETVGLSYFLIVQILDPII